MPSGHDADTSPLRLFNKCKGYLGSDHALRFPQSSDTSQSNIAPKGPDDNVGTAHMCSMHRCPSLHDPAPLALEELPPQLLSFLALLLESLQAVLGGVGAPHPLQYFRSSVLL